MKVKTMRMAALSLSVALSVSLLAGCGKAETKVTEVSEATKAVEVTQATTAPVKMETIRVWTGDGSSKDLFVKLIEEYNNSAGKQKGIQIEYEVKGGDYKKTIELAIAASQTPELFKAQGALDAYVKNGSILPIEDMPGGAEFLKKYEGRLIPVNNIVNGKTYCVPFNLVTIGLNYNKEMFKKAGIVDENGNAKPPKTWTEVREYAKKMTNPAEKAYGFAFPLKWNGFSDWYVVNPFIGSMGHEKFDQKSGKFNYSDLKPILEVYKGMIEDKSIFPGAEGLDNDTARAQFSEGRIGMIMGASWDVGVFNDQFPAKMDWGVAPIPVLDPANPYKQFENSANFLNISKSAKDANLEKVMEVFMWFNSDEVLTSMYEESKFIPYKPEIVQAAKKTPDKKGWKEYAGMADKSFISKPSPTVKLEGEDFNKVFIKILLGVTPVADGLADLDKRYNEALDKGVSSGALDISIYSNPDFDIK